MDAATRANEPDLPTASDAIELPEDETEPAATTSDIEPDRSGWNATLAVILTVCGFGLGVLIAWGARAYTRRYYRNGGAMGLLYAILIVVGILSGAVAIWIAPALVVMGFLAFADGYPWALWLGLVVLSVPIGTIVGGEWVVREERRLEAADRDVEVEVSTT